MRNYYSYIPDMTQRYSEGMYDFEPYDNGYEPSYDELLVTDPDYKEAFEMLKQENPEYAAELVDKYLHKKPEPIRVIEPVVFDDFADEDVLPFD